MSGTPGRGVRRRASAGASVIHPIVYGSIVKAPITPDGGFAKPRRSVVVAEPQLGGKVLVVGTTTDNGRYDPRDAARYDPELFIWMPYAPDGSDPTGFLVPCAAKATFLEPFDRDVLEPTPNHLAPTHLDRLVAALRAWYRKHPVTPP